jgi:calcium-dependent protein kinase
VLGKGAYGEVRVAVHRGHAAQRAVKSLKKAHMTKAEQEAMLNEINILKELDHPNIVKIFEYYEDK